MAYAPQVHTPRLKHKPHLTSSTLKCRVSRTPSAGHRTYPPDTAQTCEIRLALQKSIGGMVCIGDIPPRHFALLYGGVRMAKRFNITGTCFPNRHHMVDISDRVAQISLQHLLSRHADYISL